MQSLVISGVFAEKGQKCTKNYKAPAQLLFSLNLLFCNIAIAIMVFLSSLLSIHCSELPLPWLYFPTYRF